MKKIYRVMLLIPLLMSFLCSCGKEESVSTYAFTKENIELYDSIIEKQSKMIRDIQLPSGAIPMYRRDQSDENTINPYFSAYACLGLLETGEGEEVVQRYLDWYFTHLNTQPDVLGVIGTVYDYQVDCQTLTETSKNTYDSSDSYAAMNLGVIRRYCEVSGDTQYMAAKRTSFEMIISAMLSTLDDGLTWCRMDYQVKYLMDNAEVVYGLDSVAWVYENVYQDQKEAEYYKTLRDNVKDCIERDFWQSDVRAYAVQITAAGAEEPNWNQFYPGACGQLFPGMQGVIEPHATRNRELYQTFLEKQPEWATVDAVDEAWCGIGYAAVCVGDYDTANAFLENAQQFYLEKGGGYPWHCGEAGYLLRCAAILGNESHQSR